MSEAKQFSHMDATGAARMVDVSTKPVTRRIAEASCRVLLLPATISGLASLPKGDAIAVARLAGVQGAKQTAALIPLAHTLLIDQVDLDIEADERGVSIRSRVVINGRTGAEMEALVACSTAALALYDMVKAVDRSAVVTDLRLEHKSGGVHGAYQRGC